MNIIDFHQHLIIPPDRVKEIMDRHQITKAVTIPFDFGSFDWHEAVNLSGMNEKPSEYRSKVINCLPKVNIRIYNQIKNDNRFVFAPWISPACPDPFEALEAIPDHHWKIIKIIPVFDHCTCNYRSELSLTIKRAVKRKKIVMLHTGWGIEPDLLRCGLHGSEGMFVIAHMKEDTNTYNFQRIRIMEEFPNVYCEMSYCPTPKRIKQYVEKGFGNRLLFGSDFRDSDDEPSLKLFIEMVKIADISNDIKENILYKNAARLLNL